MTNLGGQFPEAREATETKDVAAESPNEAYGWRRNHYPDCNTVGYCLWGFQMLMQYGKLHVY